MSALIPISSGYAHGSTFSVVENSDIDRVQIFFDSKPVADVRTALKKNRFFWSPTHGAWHRTLNDNGLKAAHAFLEAMGIQSPEPAAPEAPAVGEVLFPVREIDDEPRVLDTDLGAALGMAQPRNIRQTIEANKDELAAYGSSHAARAMIDLGKGAQREVTTYWLNEPQALLLCMFARTPKAAQVRKLLIDTFMEWRRQRLAPPATPAVIAPDPRTRLAMLEARVAQLEAGVPVRQRLPATPPPYDRDGYYQSRIVQFVRDFGGAATKTELWLRLPHRFKVAQVNTWLDALISSGRLTCSVEVRGYNFAMVYRLPV